MQMVIALGNLGKDPEVRYSQSGMPVANVSLACSEKWTDKQSGEQVEKTEWLNLVAFGRTAEIMGEYLKKGSKIFIQGKLQTDKYEKDGQTRYSTKVVVKSMQMLGQPSGNGNNGQKHVDRGANQQNSRSAPQPAYAGHSADSGAPDFDFDDDIPF
ncbi:single-stranded DNA-binding protein [Acidihalobacter prosperus]|uniref:Single-stranded DNA-binding protein n=1 Tax=Acidihalobacter prosperus TaxID=160660 RepID=A0A1A6C367_9GAMM|nr:single-stranded DNA-binding protein [Acidihalobacter prosperus]OBS09004.1 hypothetical protein Thpro_022121 [Acidihalobacter prosperus]